MKYKTWRNVTGKKISFNLKKSFKNHRKTCCIESGVLCVRFNLRQFFFCLRIGVRAKSPRGIISRLTNILWRLNKWTGISENHSGNKF